MPELHAYLSGKLLNAERNPFFADSVQVADGQGVPLQDGLVSFVWGIWTLDVCDPFSHFN